MVLRLFSCKSVLCLGSESDTGAFTWAPWVTLRGSQASEFAGKFWNVCLFFWWETLQVFDSFTSPWGCILTKEPFASVHTTSLDASFMTQWKGPWGRRTALGWEVGACPHSRTGWPAGTFSTEHFSGFSFLILLDRRIAGCGLWWGKEGEKWSIWVLSWGLSGWQSVTTRMGIPPSSCPMGRAVEAFLLGKEFGIEAVYSLAPQSHFQYEINALGMQGFTVPGS